MKIIDCHMHTNFDEKWMIDAAKISGIDFSLNGLKKEMARAQIVNCMSMGIKEKNRELDKNAETPMINEVSDASIIKIAGINPYKAGKKNLIETENALKSKKIKGFKIYLGYYPFYAYDSKYLPFYKLAEKYKIPVIFHTGDTYSENALVKYAHPLGIDEIAVKFKNVNFILAHFGNPWVFDCAEVLWKNKNVYADLSGLVVGNMKQISGVSPLILKEALDFVGNYEKILYGSDWPLVPMYEYINFIRFLIPREFHEKVFYLNAKKLFNL